LDSNLTFFNPLYLTLSAKLYELNKSISKSVSFSTESFVYSIILQFFSEFNLKSVVIHWSVSKSWIWEKAELKNNSQSWLLWKL
jgi:hypothetical protein